MGKLAPSHDAAEMHQVILPRQHGSICVLNGKRGVGEGGEGREIMTDPGSFYLTDHRNVLNLVVVV